MTHREITAGAEWASRDAARADRLRAERVEQDPVAQAELDRIQWEGQRAPWMAAMDTQADGSRVTLLKPAAIGASTAQAFPIPPSWTETEVTVRLVSMDGQTTEGCFTIPVQES